MWIYWLTQLYLGLISSHKIHSTYKYLFKSFFIKTLETPKTTSFESLKQLWWIFEHLNVFKFRFSFSSLKQFSLFFINQNCHLVFEKVLFRFRSLYSVHLPNLFFSGSLGSALGPPMVERQYFILWRWPKQRNSLWIWLRLSLCIIPFIFVWVCRIISQNNSHVRNFCSPTILVWI